jgi:hypothetical protein
VCEKRERGCTKQGTRQRVRGEGGRLGSSRAWEPGEQRGRSDYGQPGPGLGPVACRDSRFLFLLLDVKLDEWYAVGMYCVVVQAEDIRRQGSHSNKLVASHRPSIQADRRNRQTRNSIFGFPLPSVVRNATHLLMCACACVRAFMRYACYLSPLRGCHSRGRVALRHHTRQLSQQHALAVWWVEMAGQVRFAKADNAGGRPERGMPHPFPFSPILVAQHRVRYPYHPLLTAYEPANQPEQLTNQLATQPATQPVLHLSRASHSR